MAENKNISKPGRRAIAMPKAHRFDIRSMKRAMAVFTLPGHGQSIHQELPGQVDETLRRAITAAQKAFDKVIYTKPIHKPKAGA